jgi:hypothetical protein
VGAHDDTKQQQQQELLHIEVSPKPTADSRTMLTDQIDSTPKAAALLICMHTQMHARSSMTGTALPTNQTDTHEPAQNNRCAHLQLEVCCCNAPLRYLPLLPLLHLWLRAFWVLVAAAACCIAAWQEPDAVHAA